MMTWRDYWIARERHEDTLRRVEQARLIRQIVRSQRRMPGNLDRALAWLGCRLVAWGINLQARYSAVSVRLPEPRPDTH